MFEAADRADRRARALEELTEIGLRACRELDARLHAAETPEQAATVALALHRMKRSVRQDLALEAKFERDREQAERAARDESRRAEAARIDTRKTQLRLTLERLIWNEADGREAEKLIADLEDRLDEDEAYGALDEGPIESHIARYCAMLELSPDNAAHKADAAEPEAPTLARPERRSSA